MARSEFIVDLRKADRTANGVVHAGCFLRLSGEAESVFPHPEWSDFVVVVLGWWLDGMARLVREEATAIAIRFMEGPFLVRLSRVTSDALRITCVETGLRERVVQEETTEPGALIASLVNASEQVLGLCEERGWQSRDTKVLKTALESLRTAVINSESRRAPS